MNLKCIAIDDEPLALKQMVSYIEKTPFLTYSGGSLNAVNGLELMVGKNPDLLFIDINMPELNGIDFVKSLNDPVMIIFTTAYSEYALDGFKVNAVDYLLKPIGYPDFLKSANKALNLYELKNNSDEILTGDKDCLFVKSEHRLIRVEFSNIKYIEGMREYVRIHLNEGDAIMTLLSMKSLEEKLPRSLFMRVHRSYIVNLSKITIVERHRIIFDKKVYIPVSDQYKKEFDSYIEKKFL
jgi:two-component system LytT family response regulator